MADDADEDLLYELADEFVERHQANECPTVEEYCDNHPHLADRIRKVFPTLIALEANKSPIPTHTHLKKIGNYDLVREIGRGGMGIVYEALHETLGRRVAVKVLPPRMATNQRSLARFHREARAIAKLHHTNIVPLYDVGAGEEPFFAMQLIPGRSLDRALRRAKSSVDAQLGPDSDSDTTAYDDSARRLLELKELADSRSDLDISSSRDKSMFVWVASIGTQIGDALQYAHEHSILHRDVKPSNILIDESGTAWLTDFGLAKTDDDGLTQTDDYVGTLGYMAPERLRGECDERADVYGLGLILYEVLAMQPAFIAGDRAKLLNLISSSNITKIRNLNSKVPSDLETIVLKAISREPRDRYQSAGALADDLRRFVQGDPIMARRTSWIELTYRWARRNRALAASLATLCTLLIVGLIGTSIAAVRFQEQADRIEQDLYRTEMLLAGREADQPGGISTIRTLMRNWIPKEGEVDRRGPEWHYYSGLGRDELLSFSHSQPVTVAEFSPNDQQVATGTKDGFLRIWNANSGKLSLEIKAHDWILDDLAYSLDGKQIVTVSGDKSAKVWDAENGDPVHDLKGFPNELTSVAIHEDGEYLAIGAGDGLRFYNANTFELVHHCTTEKGDPNWIRQMNWHPTKDLLITISNDDTMLVWDPVEGKLDTSWAWVNELPGLEFWYGNNAIEWSPSADRILAVGKMERAD